MALSRDQVLAADDKRYALVDVPAWGGQVRLASMSALRRQEFFDFSRANRDTDMNAIMPFLLVRCCVDDAGALLFTDADMPTLKEKDPDILLNLFTQAAQLNALSVEATEAQRKNSKSDTSADTHSSSRSLSAV